MRSKLAWWRRQFREHWALLAVAALVYNLLYAFYNGALGLRSGSAWFLAACGYHLILSALRFAVVTGRRSSGEAWRVTAYCGALLVLLSAALAVTLFLSLQEDRATVYGTIPMITIATYTFTKVGMAVYKAVRYRASGTPLEVVLRTIRYGEVAVALLTMQRSMLASFGGMAQGWLLNLLTGIAVCAFVCSLGILLIKRSRKDRKDGKEQACGDE